mmetsp:Transcript_2660/g.7368  ORF Transcript_2660/g.7368 Transcript_2660/m.7368 type:complete len:1107 (-) Transcript_2660:51-3371(-)|eukprot:CAMPEP_0168722232 /NCGR_PEP_ID=MMETSP0724-20121128/2491_1 /TAXON_ID=265536 /ORGANISM="Amphiprora sp., Strain CCMP467" /LENGTH=1106 /DNA_ID=CAMNT_0008768897 /DNA_START=19 /DNA_END=3339 /DNA_ORIENTATION=+
MASVTGNNNGDLCRYACAIDVCVKGGSEMSVEGFNSCICETIPSNAVQSVQLAKQAKRVYGKITFAPNVKPGKTKGYARQLRGTSYNNQPVRAQVDPSSLIPLAVGVNLEDALPPNQDEGEEYDGKWNWKNSKGVAAKFFSWLHEENDANCDGIDLASVDRDAVSTLFGKFFKNKVAQKEQKRRRYMEGLVMSALRRQKLMRNKRYSDGVVICSFAREDKSFAPMSERQTAREKLLQQRKDQLANKGGIDVPVNPTTDPKGPVMPMNQNVTVAYNLTITHDAQNPVDLVDARVTGGSHKRCFQIKTATPCRVVEEEETTLELSFQSRGTGVYRANVNMVFRDASGKKFSILRSILLRSGDSDLYDILKPAAPFVKKKRAVDKPVKDEDVVNPPLIRSGQDGGGSAFVGYKDLKAFKVPLDIRELVESREMEGTLVPPTNETPDNEFPAHYSTFWQNMLWVSELQAYEDIKLFDMENAILQRQGRFLKLFVSGLAEGRPSVLRGDVVDCFWQGKKYRGRVSAVELLDVLLEFHPSFHHKFDVRVDRVERVRFTFARTALRTSHVGSLRAPENMGQRMLMPCPTHVARLLNQTHERLRRRAPKQLVWASRTLNEEQRSACTEIVKGTLSPMPYVIFGPPGTGKTTTLVEAVYQLARLHKYSKDQPKLKILLVAPSNDASDILVEKLAPYFPPSEMIRILAYSRSINQVPNIVRPYVREGMEPSKQATEIAGSQLVITTVNLAARLWCMGDGVRKGLFDVLCVDEAGHATEPEVIGVAATMMNFCGNNPGQLVLAGDPMQLGPIITSDLCKKFGMGVSYMERLVKTSPAYQLNEERGKYPTELVTLLVRNYRSHPAILKLPNEMFYHNKLISSGDRFMTHSMSKWEHLPSDNKGFPVVFHAVDGENMREGSSPSWFNIQEVNEVVNYVKLLAKHSRPPVAQDEVGIITPYARQVQKISIALKANDLGEVKVGSVETFQGQERRCIIISTVRSENELLSHDRKYNLGFVANEKRFNVAVTRAKALLIVIGNPRVLATDKKNWLPLLLYCRDNQSWFGDEWTERDNDDNSDSGSVEDVEVVNDRNSKDLADDDEWEVVVDQEGCGFINREE